MADPVLFHLQLLEDMEKPKPSAVNKFCRQKHVRTIVRWSFVMGSALIILKCLSILGFNTPIFDASFYRFRHGLNGSKFIVIWNIRADDNSFDDPDNFFINHKCPVSKCKLSLTRSHFAYADAVVFTPILFRRVLPEHSYKEQRYVLYNMEPPTKFMDYPFYKLKDKFNLVFTYLDHPDTDIHLPMGYISDRRTNKTITDVDMTTKTKLVAWVVSNCDVIGQRNDYVKELAKYIDIDVFGKCGSMNCSTGCFKDIGRSYKFYLAFEKSYCDQYLTEKIYRTLNLNVVPVALGGANYSKLLPDHSFIDVSKHKSPKMLADYLRWLDNNDDAYLKYFDWKLKYNAIDGRNKAAGFCKLCEILHNTSYKYKTKFDFASYWNPEKTCLRGTEERRALHLE